MNPGLSKKCSDATFVSSASGHILKVPSQGNKAPQAAQDAEGKQEFDGFAVQVLPHLVQFEAVKTAPPEKVLEQPCTPNGAQNHE